MVSTLDLSGIWKLGWCDGQRGNSAFAEADSIDLVHFIDATVPGEVHLEALRQGWIADPYVGTNVLAARWVEEAIWSYRREFQAPADMVGRAWLVFEGLDYAAKIVLNGQEVGRHHNAYYPCRLDVTGKVLPGRNILTVHLDPGLFEVADKPAAGYVHEKAQELHKRHWLRKPTGQFGWDWSQRMINCGIFKPCRLEWTSDPVRIEQWSPLAELSEDLTKGTVRGRLIVEGLSAAPVAATLTVTVGGQAATVQVEIKPGLQVIEATVAIASPQLWWSREQGAQTLYEVTAKLAVDGRELGENSAQVGFRHVRVNQDANASGGRNFYLQINGRKVFCKGGNLIPIDMISAAITRQRYERLIELAVEENFNFLRIWGGGVYESDEFYELCDRAGIMVWQDFIFACGKYPTTDHAFHEDLVVEATYNIRRLASHASLVIWCGNNEMEIATWHWGNYLTGVRMPDYGFYHLTLRRLLAAEDPTRFYQPSSPFSPDFQDPDTFNMGDQHPWTQCLGLRGTDIYGYRKMDCTFVSEGGMGGPTALPTVLACLPEGQRFVRSFAWKVHENSIDTWVRPSAFDVVIEQWLGLDSAKLSIEQFVYWAGLFQGECIRELVENLRRRMFASGGLLLWMLADCWPMVRSWVSVDYYLRRTPLFHPLRRSMAPVNVVLVEEAGRVNVFGINDTPEAVSGELRYGVFGVAGGYPVDLQAAVTLPPGASQIIASFDAAQWCDRQSTLAFAMLSRGGMLLARNRLSDQKYKEMQWPKAAIAAKLCDGRAIFACLQYAWGVCLDLDGEDPLADNFFDLYPGVAYVLPWKLAKPPRILCVGNQLNDVRKTQNEQ